MVKKKTGNFLNDTLPIGTGGQESGLSMDCPSTSGHRESDPDEHD
jgi:hypothetical protein